jgi:hypothetical protein
VDSNHGPLPYHASIGITLDARSHVKPGMHEECRRGDDQ